MKLLKVSKEKEDFNNLIGKEILFANDIISINGNIIHNKNEKAIISDIEYTSGYWSNLCHDIYVNSKISSIYINGINSSSFEIDAFLEFKIK